MGTYTGYSALCMALACGRSGVVFTIEKDPEYAQWADSYFRAAEVDQKVIQMIGEADLMLRRLLDHGDEGKYDVAFLDANKEQYDLYYERVLQLLRPGGLLLINNVFLKGRVWEQFHQEDDTLAMRKLQRKILKDERVSMDVLPLGDGLMLCMKL